MSFPPPGITSLTTRRHTKLCEASHDVKFKMADVQLRPEACQNCIDVVLTPCLCLLLSWVMYEEPNFRGRMYIVERGNYSSHNEWQAQNPNIQSIRRVVNYF